MNDERKDIIYCISNIKQSDINIIDDVLDTIKNKDNKVLVEPFIDMNFRKIVKASMEYTVNKIENKVCEMIDNCYENVKESTSNLFSHSNTDKE